MCLAVPMKVTAADGRQVTCEALGATRTARLDPLYDVAPVPGDYVLVSRGAVVRTVPPEEAEQAIALFEEILAAEDTPHD